MQETQVQSLDWKDPLEKKMATHSSILTWWIPWTERSLVGYSPWGHKELDMIEWLSMHILQNTFSDYCLQKYFHHGLDYGAQV